MKDENRPYEGVPKRAFRKTYRSVSVKSDTLLAVRASLEKGGSDAVDDTIDNMMDQWIDLSPDVTFTDFIDAVFMCDYHFKILCTFYTASGEELWTIEKYASAPFISSNKRKLDAIPGNKGSTFFVGPNEAKYWYVWVSK